MVTGIAKIEMEAAESRATDSAPGKAKSMNGMPKNSKLPKTVLRTTRKKVPLENLNIIFRRPKNTNTINMGITPATRKMKFT